MKQKRDWEKWGFEAHAILENPGNLKIAEFLNTSWFRNLN